MRPSVLGAVLRQQWAVLLRDNRFKLMAAILLLASLTALASGVARNERMLAEREAAVRADTHAWDSQGRVNPHGAAHFGRYVFKPVAVLAAFEPGLLDELGSLVKLEAHRQRSASMRPSDAGTALTRFASFSAASALQMLAPLVVILLGFTAFCGENAQALLHQELGSGADARVLMLGRLIALGALIGVMLTVFAAAGGVVLARAGARSVEFAKLGLMLAGFGGYLLSFLAIALGVSALSRTPRAALTALLAFWIVAVLLVPTIAPAIAAQVHPTPSGPQFQARASEEIDARLDGGRPRSERHEQVTEAVLKKYGVARPEDLPVDLGGAYLEYGEELSTQAYRRQFAQLHEIYEQQARLARAFAPLSPLVVLKPWSAGLAGTDLAAHRQFLEEAEDYRYTFVQHLNRELLRSGPGNRDGAYATDVARLSAQLRHFEPTARSLPDIVRRQWPDGVLLGLWGIASLCFAMWSAGRLRKGV